MALARSYKSKMTLLAVAALSVAVLAGAVGSLVVRYSEPGENFWLVYPALLAVFGLAFAAVMPWWRRLDDLQKEGQLVSWYWGGQIGAVVVLMALVAANGAHSDFARGGAAVFMGEAMFFGAAWLIWRWRSRGPAE
jgi:uncharacterized membrane protein